MDEPLDFWDAIGLETEPGHAMAALFQAAGSDSIALVKNGDKIELWAEEAGPHDFYGQTYRHVPPPTTDKKEDR